MKNKKIKNARTDYGEDYMFTKDALKELKKYKKCFCYKKWQVDEILKELGNEYNTEVVLKEWYYILKIV